MSMFCKSLFVLFLLANVLSVLRFTDFDYPCGILNLFLLLKDNPACLVLLQPPMTDSIILGQSRYKQQYNIQI